MEPISETSKAIGGIGKIPMPLEIQRDGYDGFAISAHVLGGRTLKLRELSKTNFEIVIEFRDEENNLVDAEFSYSISKIPGSSARHLRRDLSKPPMMCTTFGLGAVRGELLLDFGYIYPGNNIEDLEVGSIDVHTRLSLPLPLARHLYNSLTGLFDPTRELLTIEE